MATLLSNSSTSGQYTLAVTLVVQPDNTVLATFKGTPQYIAYITYFTAAHCKATVCQVTAQGQYDVNLGPYNKDYLYNRFYYVYALNDLHYAEAVAKVLPPVRYVTQEITTRDNVFMIRISDIFQTKFINFGTTNKVIVYNGTTHKIAPDELVEVSNSYDVLANVKVRDDGKLTNISYKDLTLEEREAYVPEDVCEGITRTTNWASIHNWRDAQTALYQGTLTYIATHDKDVHMIDDRGHKYRYNMETFRPMIPHLVKGTISGTFKYAPRGNRNISYVLVPCSGSVQIAKDELVLCDSDDSDNDDTEK